MFALEFGGNLRMVHLKQRLQHDGDIDSSERIDETGIGSNAIAFRSSSLYLEAYLLVGWVGKL